MVPKLAPVKFEELIERSRADDGHVRIEADHEAELVRLCVSRCARRPARKRKPSGKAAETELGEILPRAAVEAARKSVEQAEADAKAAAVTLTHTRAALVEANTELLRTR